MDLIHPILECLAAGVGTIAFALLFQAPRTYYLPCGLIGGAGWLCYRLCAALGASAALATFPATVAVVFLARWTAVRLRCPVTIFLIPGIFPLVPGAGIYWTAYHLVTDDAVKAAVQGGITLKTAVAIVLGILLVFELPQGIFRALGAHIHRKER